MNEEMKILVVDDEEMMRMTMAAILSDAGGDVQEASDGYEAIELAKTNEFDIIFMDVKMPGINGVDAYLEIKKFRENSTVIMMTAYSVEITIEQRNKI